MLVYKLSFFFLIFIIFEEEGRGKEMSLIIEVGDIWQRQKLTVENKYKEKITGVQACPKVKDRFEMVFIL